MGGKKHPEYVFVGRKNIQDLYLQGGKISRTSIKHPEPVFAGGNISRAYICREQCGLEGPERHPEDTAQRWDTASGTGSAVLDGVQESIRIRARAMSICLGFAGRVVHGKELQDSMP